LEGGSRLRSISGRSMIVLDRRDLPLRPPPRAEAFVRIRSLDVLRGAALVGAFVINLAVFSVDGGSPLIHGGLDRVIAVSREVLTDGKWYPVFAFLFGYSLALQLRGRVPMVQRRRQVARRLAAIGVLGIAHGLLLYRWDILLAYGVLGTVLYATRQFSSRAQGVGIGVLVMFGAWLATEPSISPEQMGFRHIYGPAAVEVYQNGSLFDVVALHGHNYAFNMAQEILAQWPYIMAMMLLGLLAERHLVFTNASPVETRARRVAYVVGVSSFAWNTIAEITKFDRGWRLTTFVGTLTILGQAVGAVALITRDRSFGFVSRQLSSLGRMSLTNYLSQSVVCTTMAFGYGFGLGPHLTPSRQLVVLVFIVAGQIWFSRWWLARHDHGPIEGLVSKWTRHVPHKHRVPANAH
jgi:uncharacterized protein